MGTGRKLNVLGTFSLRPVSRGDILKNKNLKLFLPVNLNTIKRLRQN